MKPLWRGLASPLFWVWIALSALPPELISKALGLDWVDPAYLAALLLWWPVDTFCRLAALRVLLTAADPRGEWRPSRSAVASALAAEILLSLRCAAFCLAGVLPALALFSLLRPAQLLLWPWRLGLLALALAGTLPACLYALRRILAPLELLRSRLRAGEALDASARRLDGRLGAFLRMALPWIALSWLLDLVSLALPDSVSLGLTLPSVACMLVPIALSERL